MDARDQLRRVFGFEDFRPGQADAVSAALTGRDALVVMPTGSGKSVCYQLPALLRDDLTVVVSPLVSLMQDQVAALELVAPGAVAVVNAQRGFEANAASLRRVRDGAVKLLYVAPERFGSPAFADALRGASVGLFAVDEAHCVSQWGHDFRPDYFSLADAAARLGARATIALTATATPRVAEDIVARLRLRDPVRVTTGFDRPNLSFAVIRCGSRHDKERRLVAALREPDALPAIVYAGTRGASEQLAHALGSAVGEPALAYHAGMARGDRATTQERFMSGDVRMIVATNAFGMGIDKADVRTVAHASVPGSLEAYYQEAGRAGRDGLPARCLLFAEQRDKGLHVFFIERSRLAPEAFERVGERLNSWMTRAPRGQLRLDAEGAASSRGIDGRYELPLSELTRLVAGDDDSVRAVIGHLARAGVLTPAPAAPDRAAGAITGGFDRRAAAVCQSSAREAERLRWAQYRSVWEYVETPRCRREALLAHFGDRGGGRPTVACCDVCDPTLVPATGRAASGDLDRAIVDVVKAARPPVGRTRAVEILRGGRSRVVAEHRYHDLNGYGTFSHLRSGEVLERVDELLAAGTLRSTGGRFPKLRAA